MNLTLLADFYELSMMQGYFLHHENPPVVFDMFFRRQPFGGGFTVFAGLEPALQHVASISFTADDLGYLEGLGTFHGEFLDSLASLRFRGDIWAMEEGTLAFPGEPLVRVHASLMEAQLIESALLAIVNFQTLIATKAARIRLAANGGPIIEFGLRRYGIPVRGIMAHSWTMAFATEREAFEKYAEIYLDGAVLLIDTYDTLGSGVENAIAVGRGLKAAGQTGFGVRLDSGDLEYLSQKVRARLDAAGLHDATIVASNELDERIIQQLITRGAPIDSWGVGTSLVTGGGDPALSGVYKIATRKGRDGWIPTIKVSNNPDKVTNPGVKQVWRFTGNGGSPLADLICRDDEQVAAGGRYTFHHPLGDYRSFTLADYAEATPLLGLRMRGGDRVGDQPDMRALQARAPRQLDALDDTYKPLINSHVYRVSLSDRLNALKSHLIEDSLARGAQR